jgi:hypothetical protein
MRFNRAAIPVICGQGTFLEETRSAFLQLTAVMLSKIVNEE